MSVVHENGLMATVRSVSDSIAGLCLFCLYILAFYGKRIRDLFKKQFNVEMRTEQFNLEMKNEKFDVEMRDETNQEN